MAVICSNMQDGANRCVGVHCLQCYTRSSLTTEVKGVLMFVHSVKCQVKRACVLCVSARQRLRTPLPRIFLFNVRSLTYRLGKIETFIYLHFMLPLTFLVLSTTTLEGLILGLPYLTHWE